MTQSTNEQQGDDQAETTHTEHNQQKQQEGQQPKPVENQASPMIEKLKANWKQQMGSAKTTWGKLTNDELLKSEGRAEKLAGLVQERYAITRAEADKQVKSFIEKCNA